MGSALMGSLQIPVSFDRGTFGVLPLTYFLSSQKCQGVPFSPICQIHNFCGGPISVDPICPQPKGTAHSARPTRKLRIREPRIIVIIVIILELS